MGTGINIGISNTSKKVKNFYVGISDKPKKIKKAWIGVNGVPKLFYSASRLPDGYQEVEYIKPFSNYYLIKSGIGYKQNPRVYVEFGIDDDFVGYIGCLFGYGLTDTKDDSFSYSVFSNSLNSLIFEYGRMTDPYGYSEFTYETNTPMTIGKHTIDFNKKENSKSTFYLDGKKIGEITPSNTSLVNYLAEEIYLLNYNYPTHSSHSNCCNAKFYTFRIYSNTNVLLRDLIPCYNDSYVGFYDLINNKFYSITNKTDTEIQLGPDI